MEITSQSILKMSVSDIKYYNKGYFFSRDTMKFFGDKMSSFGVRTYDGRRILYRKPNAYVKTPFSGVQKAGKLFFSCWEVIVKSENEVDLMPISDDFKNLFYNSLNV
jgi:hypothetical protein